MPAISLDKEIKIEKLLEQESPISEISKKLDIPYSTLLYRVNEKKKKIDASKLLEMKTQVLEYLYDNDIYKTNSKKYKKIKKSLGFKKDKRSVALETIMKLLRYEKLIGFSNSSDRPEYYLTDKGKEEYEILLGLD